MIINLANKKIIEQFSKFIIVGLINSSFNYLLFYTCLILLKFHYIISGTLGFTLGALIGYQLNRSWSFNSKINYKKGLKTYLLIQFFCLIIHNITLISAIEYLQIKDVFSQLVGIIVTTLINFYLIKKFVFKKL